MIEDSIKKTLEFFPDPLLAEELFEMLVVDEPVKREEFFGEVRAMREGGRLFEQDGYVGLLPDQMISRIARTKEKDKQNRECFGTIRKRSSLLERFPQIKMIALAATLNQPKGFCAFVLVEGKYASTIRKFILWYFGTFMKDCKIIEIINLAGPSLEVPKKDLRMAYKLLFLHPIINKDGIYEKFMHKNGWIFNYFANYPLQKISLGYRVNLNPRG